MRTAGGLRAARRSEARDAALQPNVVDAFLSNLSVIGLLRSHLLPSTAAPSMTKVLPANFSSELLTIMKSALDNAVHQIDRSNRTPATKAKMAQRIVKTASEGVTDLHELVSAAVDEGRVPAA